MGKSISLEDLNHFSPDVVVVGTGIGGATLGYTLAKRGKKVLFLEKGEAFLSETDELRGRFAEMFPDSDEDKQSTFRRAGRYWEEVQDISNPHPRSFVPFIGSGGGGSSRLFGMVFERFLPSDFYPRKHFPHITDSSIPESWPISYPDLEPFYESAEKLYQVTLPSPAPGSRGRVSACGQELYDFLLRKDLHPYWLPLACERQEDCEGCQSYLCPKNCKNDSNKMCLRPAVEKYGAVLLDNCQVIKLKAGRKEVTDITLVRNGERLTLKVPLVILAAGALETPRILLNSVSAEWPQGVANDSGLVGKNLMRHYADLYAIFPKTRKEFFGKLKEIGMNDFYVFKNQKLGTLQSFGPWIPPKVIADDLQEHCPPLLRKLFTLIKPILKAGLNWISSRTILLASMMEDLPYEDNQVRVTSLDSKPAGTLAIRYRIHDYDKIRIRTFRKMLRSVFHPYRYILLKQAENIERIAHVCGTCRFGENPTNSVLDPWNRAHGISNLYVVDSSFLPSGGGTNPALTIAANALRVAEHLARNRES